MCDLISREAAVKIAERYSISKGSVIGKHSGIAEIIADKIAELPSVPAVQLDKLCEWLAENALCITRKNTTPLKTDARHWKSVLTEWMANK